MGHPGIILHAPSQNVEQLDQLGTYTILYTVINSVST